MVALPGFEYIEKGSIKAFDLKSLVFVVDADIDAYLSQNNKSYNPPKDFEEKIRIAINNSELFKLINTYDTRSCQNAKKVYYQFIKELISKHRLSPSVQEINESYFGRNETNEPDLLDEPEEPAEIDQTIYSFLEEKIILFIKYRKYYAYDIQNISFKEMSEETQNVTVKIKADLKVLNNFSTLGIQQLCNRVAMKQAFYKSQSK